MRSMIIAALLSIAATAPAHAGEVSRQPFGILLDGAGVEAVTLTNAHGVAATVITYGAALQALVLPDASGAAQGGRADVTLGHAKLREYLDKREHMGAVVRRVANRVAGARFVLDGREVRVTVNDGASALHGGTAGFDRAV